MLDKNWTIHNTRCLQLFTALVKLHDVDHHRPAIGKVQAEPGSYRRCHTGWRGAQRLDAGALFSYDLRDRDSISFLSRLHLIQLFACFAHGPSRLENIL